VTTPTGVHQAPPSPESTTRRAPPGRYDGPRPGAESRPSSARASVVGRQKSCSDKLWTPHSPATSRLHPSDPRADVARWLPECGSHLAATMASGSAALSRGGDAGLGDRDAAGASAPPGAPAARTVEGRSEQAAGWTPPRSPARTRFALTRLPTGSRRTSKLRHAPMTISGPSRGGQTVRCAVRGQMSTPGDVARLLRCRVSEWPITRSRGWGPACRYRSLASSSDAAGARPG
jgi:hypothetical protein